MTPQSEHPMSVWHRYVCCLDRPHTLDRVRTWRRCTVCDMPYLGHHTSRYCDWLPCRHHGARRHRRARQRGIQWASCVVCHRRFPTHRRTARYCRPACKQKAYRERDAKTSSINL